MHGIRQSRRRPGRKSKNYSEQKAEIEAETYHKSRTDVRERMLSRQGGGIEKRANKGTEHNVKGVAETKIKEAEQKATEPSGQQ
mmetsp:Transcript_104114/g.179384  ORF Transcript_104114/g.179384 Transcript_104114/m.179384 type:complete len:84 (+) Transcript_104114:2031-2282(+)